MNSLQMFAAPPSHKARTSAPVRPLYGRWSLGDIAMSRPTHQNQRDTRSFSSSPSAPLQRVGAIAGETKQAALPGTRPVNHTGLPDRLKTGVEHLSGISLDDVQVHYNSPLPTQMNALAYTQGTQIHVGPGQTKYVPHEAWHVVQQKQGRVKPTLQMKGVGINDNAELEHEATVMGTRALQVPGSGQPARDERRPAESHTHRGAASPAQLQATPGSGKVIQRAIGLEIEIPVPIDRLTNPQVQEITNQVVVTQNPLATPQQILLARTRAQGIRDTRGRVGYGPIRPSNQGFRVDADHDNRVQLPTPQWPFREGGADSIIEIVMDPPALDEAAFDTTMTSIDGFINQINMQTNNLTTRWINAFNGINIGPMDYTAIGIPNERQARHNFRGSIQVNIGIDPREYQSLIKWYGKSDYAKAASGASADERALYAQIRQDISRAVDVGKDIASNIAKNLSQAERQNMGNLRGLRGWLTYLAFYLKRGGRTDIGGGTPKNAAPVLLKSPNQIFSNYGLTADEQTYFTNNQIGIMTQILRQVGRGNQVTVPLDLNRIAVFATVPNAISAADLSNLLGTRVPLTGGPLPNPTGVGPQRTGNAAVQGLPQVPAGNIGGGANTRGGVVLEFRTLPQLYDGVASWREVGLAFLRAAEQRNNRSGIEA